jgi:hypothetical protein
MTTHSPTLGDRISLQHISAYEILFYIYLSYSIIPGLDEGFSFLGAGWLALLAFLGVLQRKQNKSQTFLLLLISVTAGSYLFIQMGIHDLPLDQPYVKPILLWILMASTIYGLINKPGFLPRLGVAIFILTLILIPFYSWGTGSRIKERAIAEGAGVGNPNDLGAWVGFAVLMFWLRFLKTTNFRKRLQLGACAFIGLLMLMQTLSRGSLLALAAGMVIALLDTRIERKFITILVIAILGIIAWNTPVFLQGIKDYDVRMTEIDKSPRIELFFNSVEEFFANPWFGNGADKVDVPIERRVNAESPHNGFLLLGIAGGVVPFFLFLGLWLTALYFAVSYRGRKPREDVSAVPLLIYAFMQTLVSHFYWTHPWAVAAIFYSAVMVNMADNKYKLIKRAY